MTGSALIEMFGRIILGFTRNVAENYNPNEVGFDLEAVGFNSLELTSSEWNFHSVDELISKSTVTMKSRDVLFTGKDYKCVLTRGP